MSTDTQVEPAEDTEAVIDAYEAQRSFTFNGVQFRPGDPITMAVFRHRRFEALVNTGYIRAVK